MGILQDKRVLITGVLTDASLAFGVAETALAEGAEIVLTGAGRGMGLTTRMGRKLATGAGLPAEAVEVLELDVTVPEHFAALTERLTAKWGGIDAALHAIGFAPAALLGQEDGIWTGEWTDVATAVQISAYSMKPLAQALLPLWQAAGGGSYVGLTFDATVAWPAYDWMGVAKAAMESLNRYLARDLGPHHVRSNLVAAGPVKTIAAKSIPGFTKFEERWKELAPLGWDVHDSVAVAKSVVALLSDWFPLTTGEIIHVDGGYHAIGA
jgi:meromycolic acid enoyl-[acyl-carrier-protein] reductase